MKKKKRMTPYLLFFFPTGGSNSKRAFAAMQPTVFSPTPHAALPEHQICARDLAQFSQTKFSHRTVPQNFPFLTVRPQDPVADVTCEQGLLSIIIPYYNLGASLAKTLESVFAVDYPNYEVIIIDDGSTERDSVSILRKMELLYPNLKVIRQENHGLSYVRNRGCEIAQGEYITFLDADDLIAPRFLSASYCPFKAVSQCRLYQQLASILRRIEWI